MSKRATAIAILAIAAFSCSAAAAKDYAQPRVLGSAKNVVIDAAVVRERLPIAAAALRSKTELVLRNIQFDAHPGTQFHVVLERRDDRAKRARAGTLSFYASTRGRTTVSRTFDVTDELRQIAASGADLESVDVVFEATSGRGGANAEASFDSKLTIAAIELRVKAK